MGLAIMAREPRFNSRRKPVESIREKRKELRFTLAEWDALNAAVPSQTPLATWMHDVVMNTVKSGQNGPTVRVLGTVCAGDGHAVEYPEGVEKIVPVAIAKSVMGRL